MWISKKRWEAMEKRMADLEKKSKGQPEKPSARQIIKATGEEKISLKCFSKSFSEMIQLFRILTEPIDFSNPFVIEVEYDPNQPRAEVHYTMPRESVLQHIRKAQGS